MRAHPPQEAALFQEKEQVFNVTSALLCDLGQGLTCTWDTVIPSASTSLDEERREGGLLELEPCALFPIAPGHTELAMIL